MASPRVVASAVEAALESARPVDGEQAFNPMALGEVLRLCTSAVAVDAVVGAVEAALSSAVTSGDPDAVAAAVALRTRVVAGSTSHLVPVENLQGDVGTG